MLWVRNSSVFLSNCIIWVEWISDRLYIKKFLELFYESNKDNESFKKYEEDKHFSILEYGGWNITHFNFDDWDSDEDTMNIEAIQKNNFMIADNDWNWNWTSFDLTNAKWERLEKLEKIFEENIFYKHREIENILWIELFKKYWEKFLNDEENKKEIKYDLRDEENIDWEKENIWKILKKHFISPKEWSWPWYYQKNIDITVMWRNKTDFSKDIIKIIEENILNLKI
jgi:hypothetical protein